MVLDPFAEMTAGAAVLEPMMYGAGFSLHMETVGRSSGGEFCSASFTNGTRRLELHVRWSLGLVTYHVGASKLSHEEYLRAQHRKGTYPGFSNSTIEAFHHLRDDLELAGRIFLIGAVPEFEALVNWASKNPKPTGFRALKGAE